MAVIQVVVGLIKDQAERILLSKRIPPSSYPGYWELPGGKIESGESALEALKREMFEEIGIEVLAAQSVKKLQHTYTDYTVNIEVFAIIKFRRKIVGAEGQDLGYFHPHELEDLQVLPTLVECI